MQRRFLRRTVAHKRTQAKKERNSDSSSGDECEHPCHHVRKRAHFCNCPNTLIMHFYEKGIEAFEKVQEGTKTTKIKQCKHCDRVLDSK